MNFEKWQALGNDYLIVEADALPFALTPPRIRALCALHFGVGADGVLLLARSEDRDLVASLRIFNPDGSEAELSGNGAREAALYLRRRGWADRDTFAIATAAGVMRPEVTGPGTCRMDMGRASLASKDFPEGPGDGLGAVMSGDRIWAFRHISIGNPQCAIHVASVQELEALDLGALGPSIEADAQFPNRTNVSWYADLTTGNTGNKDLAGDTCNTGRIRARIFERGVGETLSSGTGATGAAVAYALEQGEEVRPSRVTVVLDGGELDVEVGEDLHVHLTGWAQPVFAGALSDDFVSELKELHETE